MKAKLLPLLLLMSAVVGLVGCHDTPDSDYGSDSPADPVASFNALWTTIDQHYCFFDEKRVDWDSVYRVYRPQVDAKTKYFELFDVCARMVDELRDGHVNLISSFKTSYYRKWWSDYPQNFDLRLLQEHYFDFTYSQSGGIMYDNRLADSTVGYIQYGSFSSPVGDGQLDLILLQMAKCKGLIIDVRNNGGGSLSNVETLVSRFIDRRIVAGSMQHKTGPGHNDFSKPYTYYFEPNKEHVRWLRPVVVLTNRSTFSAANNFAGIMKSLPTVKIVGATTGGGCGMPMSSEIPCGWGIRMSGTRIYDPYGQLTEQGVDPSPGCAVDLDPVKALQGHDTMLDFAIELLKN